jgi:hypothetical protein
MHCGTVSGLSKEIAELGRFGKATAHLVGLGNYAIVPDVPAHLNLEIFNSRRDDQRMVRTNFAIRWRSTCACRLDRTSFPQGRQRVADFGQADQPIELRSVYSKSRHHSLKQERLFFEEKEMNG